MSTVPAEVPVLLTPATLAESFGITEKQLLELRRKHDWPCVRLSHKSIRFTPEQAAAIVAQHATSGATTDGPAPVTGIAGLLGQTKGSRART